MNRSKHAKKLRMPRLLHRSCRRWRPLRLPRRFRRISRISARTAVRRSTQKASARTAGSNRKNAIKKRRTAWGMRFGVFFGGGRFIYQGWILPWSATKSAFAGWYHTDFASFYIRIREYIRFQTAIPSNIPFRNTLSAQFPA